jgi:hypothetical protein
MYSTWRAVVEVEVRLGELGEKVVVLGEVVGAAKADTILVAVVGVGINIEVDVECAGIISFDVCSTVCRCRA